MGSKLYLTFSFLFTLLTLTVSAQNIQLTGKIVNEKNEPLPGVTISVPGIRGITSDVEGRYRISLAPKQKYEIEFSAIGYASKKINDVEVGQGLDNELNVVLVVDS